MGSVSKVRLQNAMTVAKEIVNIYNADTDCFYKCPDCGELVFARKGKKQAWHFAHKANGNSSCGESDLHRTGKSLFKQLDYIVYAGVQYNIKKAKFEQKFGNYIIDVVLECEGNTEIFVEVYVTHRIGNKKLDYLDKKGKKVIELNLSGLSRDISIPKLKEILKEESWRWEVPEIKEDNSVQTSKTVLVIGGCSRKEDDNMKYAAPVTIKDMLGHGEKAIKKSKQKQIEAPEYIEEEKKSGRYRCLDDRGSFCDETSGNTDVVKCTCGRRLRLHYDWREDITYVLCDGVLGGTCNTTRKRVEVIVPKCSRCHNPMKVHTKADNGRLFLGCPECYSNGGIKVRYEINRCTFNIL